jgi:hypothetical protein
MNVIEDEEEQQQKEPTPTIETLEQKIEELATSIDDLRTINYMYTSRKKAIKNLIREARQLASDLNVDEIQFRKMISRIFVNTGVSESWLRKLLPGSLKFTKHTRKDYLEREQQRDQESLIQPQEQHQELVELPESRQPELEQQQPSDGKAREVTTFDNKLAEMPQKEEEEKLKQRIKELQTENEYLREVNATQAQQQQQLEQQHQQKQEEETFTSVGQLNLGKYYLQIRVTVNVKTKSVDFMDVDWQLAAYW